MPGTAKPEFIQQQYAFAAHIRNPQGNAPPAGIEDRRMGIYRELFYNNVEGFLSNAFPVLRTLLDDEYWHAMARDFFSRHHCHTPLFLEIPREFLNYLDEERGDRNEDPPFMRELAHYEWVELALSVAEEDILSDVDTDGDLLDNAPILSSLAWPLSYHYPVHQISREFQPSKPGEQPTYLLVYRDSNDEVSFLELNPVSARLFSLIQENPAKTGRSILGQIATELQHPDPAQVIAGGLEILGEWRQRGIVPGTSCDTKQK